MSTMRDVDHTHPQTDEPFGEPFERGPDVATDGGRDDQSRRRQTLSDGSERFEGPRKGKPRADDEEATDEETMEDVDHEAPTEGTTRAFERGTEGRDDSV